MYQDIATQQLRYNMNGMIILLVWAVANIIFGLILANKWKDSQQKKSFYLANAVWNVVNLVLALGSMVLLSNIVPTNLKLSELLYTFFNFEKLIALNLGLDIAFVAIGSFLVERGKHMKKMSFEGYGKALWIQGGFLFLLDICLYVLNWYFNQKYSVFILF